MKVVQPTKYRTLGCLRRGMLGIADKIADSRLIATWNARNSRQNTGLSADCDVRCSEQPTKPGPTPVNLDQAAQYYSVKL